jgi:tripartite-type tricarboxylate transporter receptor subunit TctC
MKKVWKLLFQSILTVLLITVAVQMAPSSAVAEDAADYPSKDIRFVCAFPPGSGADVLVRYFAEKVRPVANRTIIVENKSGASGNIATEYTARSNPDGYTIYVHAASAIAANMHLFKNPPVDVRTALQVAATINQQPFMLTVDAKSPWKTVAELTAYVKEKGDKASYAITAPTGQVMGALYKEIMGLKAVEVPYRTGADTLNDIFSGRIDYAMHDPVLSLAQARAGKLRILAVSTITRMKAIPQYPTMDEEGVKGLHVPGWWAALVPAATPKPIVDKINKWFVEVVSTDEVKAFLNKFGGDPFIATPEEAQKLFISDVDAWGEYVKMAKIPLKG